MTIDQLRNRARMVKHWLVRKPLVTNESAIHERLGFHGDVYLLNVVAAIIPHVDVFIETGTNIGTTSGYVARTFSPIPCLSCEPDRSLYQVALKYTSSCQNISIFNETSQDFLKRLKRDTVSLQKTPLFWLDAHGEGFLWPLCEEIAFITREFQTAYILIDDFEVPGMECFGFDVWDGQRCSFDYIQESLNPRQRYTLYYPDYTEVTSTYHPLRGWSLITFGNDAETVAALQGSAALKIRRAEAANSIIR